MGFNSGFKGLTSGKLYDSSLEKHFTSLLPALSYQITSYIDCLLMASLVSYQYYCDIICSQTVGVTFTETCDSSSFLIVGNDHFL